MNGAARTGRDEPLMLTVEEALALVLEAGKAACRRIPARLIDALGCPLAEDVVGRRRPAAVRQGARRRLRRPARSGPRGRRPAARRSARRSWPARRRRGPSGPGEAAVIMTGAPLPAGADAVVMHEHNPAAGGRGRRSRSPDVRPGQNRLLRGQDLPGGRPAPAAGERSSSPAALGLLASVGRTRGPR